MARAALKADGRLPTQFRPCRRRWRTGPLSSILEYPGRLILPHYFFDTRDNDVSIRDDEGMELPDVQAAAKAAARSLVELAQEVLPGVNEHCLGVDVRDDQDRDVLTTELTYKAVFHSATSSVAEGGTQ
ncbi:DUF6894 family protein [Sphingomonas sp. M1-B02]|uniref:DUF6894 family protein n=1 Tax=Sphingomonas sp. M1-B02 TaxID=3114300 RepID=UPI0022404814|nr:hypothetical protein [Sphingomonas sp. S6-11]UZK64647.1 hypothetical protein OKW87_08785 [Sphingomonas sp. S6-11]